MPPTQPGTFETIALELANALRPIAERMRDDRAIALIAELGLELPHDMPPELEQAFRDAVAHAEALPQATQDLITAIDGGDTTEIVANAVVLIGRIAVLTAAFVTIADHLGAHPIPGLAPADLAAFVADLPKRLTETVIVEYLGKEHPLVLALMELFGLAEQIRHNPGSLDPLHPEHVRKSLRLDRLQTLLTSPDQLATDVYKWGAADFDGPLLVRRLGAVLEALDIDVTPKTLPGPPPRPAIELGLVTIAPTAVPVAPPGLDALLMLSVAEGLHQDIPIP